MASFAVLADVCALRVLLFMLIYFILFSLVYSVTDAFILFSFLLSPSKYRCFKLLFYLFTFLVHYYINCATISMVNKDVISFTSYSITIRNPSYISFQLQLTKITLTQRGKAVFEWWWSQPHNLASTLLITPATQGICGQV